MRSMNVQSKGCEAVSGDASPPRLAIVTSHPIQYNAPWFRHLAALSDLRVRVFYLWDYGIKPRFDPGFQQAIQWDIPLLSGYQYCFVPNKSRRPGTSGFLGLWNPSIVQHIDAFKPSAILMLGTISRAVFTWCYAPDEFPSSSVAIRIDWSESRASVSSCGAG